MEERRSNTCHCRVNAIKSYKALYGDAKEPELELDFGHFAPAPPKQEQGFLG
jgi:hypothetical protein